MNIPDKVKIGNINYEIVKTQNELIFEDEPVDGTISFEESKIELNTSNKSKQYIEETFIHEMVHGIFNYMGINQSEKLVDKVTKGFHQLVIDNPGIFEKDPRDEKINKFSINLKKRLERVTDN
ncbi:hypothetical protein [Candidatus Clostridium helianthi]|uniref:Phage protein n=1 Tax=Candidatus Clostridium helianthi TaxID=3381660 RepID=A0ABW8S440_9CLOT